MTNKINLNVKYDIDREKDKNAGTNEEITVNYFVFAVRLAYEKGLPSDKRRMFVRIKEKLDEAAKAHTEVELTDIDLIFIKDAFNRSVAPATEAKFMTMAEEAFGIKE